MFRNTMLALALLALGACGGGKPKSDQALAAEAIKHDATRDAVAVYFACVERVALVTPNGKSALDLDRLDRVNKACEAEDAAMLVKLAETWDNSIQTPANVGRVRGLRNEATKIIREHPYEPPTVSMEADPQT